MIHHLILLDGNLLGEIWIVMYRKVASSRLSRLVAYLSIFRLWQYGLWSYQTGGTKLERFLPKNQHT